MSPRANDDIEKDASAKRILHPRRDALSAGLPYDILVRREMMRLSRDPKRISMDKTVFQETEARATGREPIEELLSAWQAIYNESRANKTVADQFRWFLQHYFRSFYLEGWGYHQFVHSRLDEFTGRFIKRALELEEGQGDTEAVEAASGLNAFIVAAANAVRYHLNKGHGEQIVSRRRPIRVVYLTPEARPYSETGGLAGVGGPLPLALNQGDVRATSISLDYSGRLKNGHEPIMHEFTPAGASLHREYLWDANRGAAKTFSIDFGSETHVFKVKIAGSKAAYVNNPKFYFLEDVTPGIWNLTQAPYGMPPVPLTPVYQNRYRLMQARLFSEGALLLMRYLIERNELSRPELVEGHDWPTALVTFYLKTKYARDPVLNPAGEPPIQTGQFIHNNLDAYQGRMFVDDPVTRTWVEDYYRMLGLGDDFSHLHGFVAEAFVSGAAGISPAGRDPARLRQEGVRRTMNLLQAGIFHADQVVTTSKVFARLAQTPEQGHGLDQLLRLKAAEGKFYAVTHGYSYDSRHALLRRAEDRRLFLDAKRRLKALLLKATDLWPDLERTAGGDPQRLEAELDKPVAVFVGRMDAFQKGLDLLHPEWVDERGRRANPFALERWLKEGRVRIILFGDDPTRGTGSFVRYARRCASEPSTRGRYALYTEYNVPLSDETQEAAYGLLPGREIRGLRDLLYAGGDVFLMLSRSEPYGFTVAEAHEFGQVVVGSTNGGPAEQIVDYRVDPARGNGALFGPLYPEVDHDLEDAGLPPIFGPLAQAPGFQARYAPEAFAETLTQLLALRERDRAAFERLQVNAYNRRSTWEQSALEHQNELAKRLGRRDLIRKPTQAPRPRPLIPG